MNTPSPLQKASPAFRRVLFEGTVAALKPKVAISTCRTTTVRELVDLLATHSMGCVLIRDQTGSLEGIVSERDILAHSEEYSAIQDKPCHTIMTAPAQCLPSYGSIARALYYMVAGGYRHLPITGIKSQDGRTRSNLGIISIKSIATYLNQHFGRKISEDCNLSDLGDDLAQLFCSPLSALKPHPAITLSSSASVHDAIRAMNTHSTGSILITGEKQQIQGIFTERDLISRILNPGLSPGSTPIASAMTPRPHTMTDSSSIALALSVFASGKYRHLPVVDDFEKILGVLSLKDFIRALTAEVLRELGA